MKPEGQGYFLKEYGSWSVLVVSFLAGLGVSRAFPWQGIPLLAALALLVNSKQAWTKWTRQPSKGRHLIVFLGHLFAAAAIMLALFGSTVTQLLPLLVFPVAYLLTSRFAGEHAAATELLGFALLGLAAVLAKFLVVQGIDVRLFVAVALYFGAGVFKIKSLLLRKMRYRLMMLLYVLFAAFIYRRFYISLLLLVPLAENIVAVLTLYKVRLRTTGWIEVGKSMGFLALLILYF
jgi:hypothetical protein